MGQSASRVTRSRDVSRGIVVTLDALGTIYRFKKPVGEQYVEVARRCGLRTVINPEDVTRAFKLCYKSYVSEFPNYGKDKLDSPETWWNRLATETFRQVVDANDIPPNLGSRLYEHFSSDQAYELFPDVRPFLQSMRKLRNGFNNVEGPAIILGVITNSDPRVRQVFQSLALNVGDVQHATLVHNAISIPEDFKAGRFTPPWHNAYDVKRDFDFLTTSYESGSEKPSPGIFVNAQKQASVIMLGRSSADLDYSLGASGLKSMMSTIKLVSNSVDLVSRMQWIHIGDELVKDYDGASRMGFDALLLDREDEHESIKGRISNLEEAATVIGLMAYEGFGKP